MNLKSAITVIEKHGILLVYPINNQKEPLSLWSCFYPKSEMRWEWDEDGDDRVSKLWHLRMELSRSDKVVYAKWYRDRATFFSKDVFTALLTVLGSPSVKPQELTPEARQILDLLEMDSPLSTKQIKHMTELRGRALEPLYTKAMKQLWGHLLIVGHGEVEDGAFPSLAIGATRILFEDLWNEAKERDPKQAWAFLKKKLPSHFFNHRTLKARTTSDSIKPGIRL